MELAQYLLECMKNGIKVDFHRIEGNEFILRLTKEINDAVYAYEQIFSLKAMELATAPEAIIGREFRRAYETFREDTKYV